MSDMKKLTKKRIKEEILRVVEMQEDAYWGKRGYAFLCHTFFGEMREDIKKWIYDQGCIKGPYSNNVESSHFIIDNKEDINSSSCAAIFRTMILIEFAKSLGVKI